MYFASFYFRIFDLTREIRKNFYLYSIEKSIPQTPIITWIKTVGFSSVLSTTRSKCICVGGMHINKFHWF